MKMRLIILLSLIGLLSVGFSPLNQQSVLTRPTIKIDAGGQIAEEAVFSYCWPVAANNNQCNFSATADDTLTPLAVEAGQPINVIIENGPSDPSSLTATLTDPATEVSTTTNLDPTIQSIFNADLAPGRQLLQIDAVYDQVAGVRAYVSYRFALDVFSATATVAPTPAEDTSPTEEAAPTEEVTEIASAPTEEVAATEEATEESGAPTQPTQETSITDETPVEPTEIPETQTIDEQTSTPASSTPTRVPPTQITPTLTPTLAQPSATPTQPVSGGQTETAPDQTSGATATTIGLVTSPEAGATVEIPVTATLAASETPAPSATSPIAQPNEPAGLQLIFAGQTYMPVGVNFCQTSATGEQVCVDRPLEAEGEFIALLQNFAIQVQLLDGPRPESVELVFQNINTLAEVQKTTRPGDNLLLFNVNVPAGTYFMRVTVDWGTTQANYFFRVRVS